MDSSFVAFWTLGGARVAKSAVEKYAAMQDMELHDESVSRLQTGVHVVVRGQKLCALTCKSVGDPKS